MTFVSVPVNITYPSVNISVLETENSTVTLICNASGFPKPSITWQPVRDESRIFIGVNTAMIINGLFYITSNLSFSPIIRSDAIDYTCIASNTIMESIVMVNRVFTISVY